MKSQIIYRSKWTMLIALPLIFVIVGCTGQGIAPTSPPVPSSTAQADSPTQETVASPPPEGALSPTPQSGEATTTSEPGTEQNVLYQDSFTNKATRWPEADFGDYFIGYHEPEYYHIEIKTAHARAPVVTIPKDEQQTEQQTYPDATIELQVFTVAARTATDGDYRYGVTFRRSGDNYYAFTISPTTKKWEVLKRSPNGLEVLKEGMDENIQGLDTADLLRVDAQGSSFLFSINDSFVGEVTDSAYTDGEIGLYAENLENSTTHVHFDTLTVQKLQAPPPEDLGAVQYQDSFTNKATRWPEADFGDYFIGYHEPEYYHIEIKTAHAQAPVVTIPKDEQQTEQQTYPDATIELQVFTVAARTATDGDYRYGVTFRRSGDNYYAFTISPTTKKWEVLKRSPNGLEVLKEGMDENIQGLDTADLLRVDAQGSSFLFSINGQRVDQVTDSAYTDGEIGLYAENLENSTTHVHFDTLTVREFKFSGTCTVPAGETVYVRSGPGQKNAQTGLLSSGQTVKALGISPNQWIQIIVEGSNEPGWVAYQYEGGQLSCTPSVDLFPIISP